MGSAPAKGAERPVARELQINGLHELSAAVNGSERLEDIYQASISALRGALGADRASILLYDAGFVMRFVAWHNLSDTYRKAVDGHSPWTPDSVNPAPIFVEDVRLDSSLEAYLPIFDAEGLRALGFIPLLYRSRLLGKFMVYFDQPHRFTEEEARIVQTIANSVAFAIEKSRTEQEVRDLNAELEQRVEARTAELQKTKADLESFCYSVSHDLRAPLRGMMSAAMMLLEDYPDKLDAEGQEHLKRLSQASNKMAQLIDDLLQYSRLGRKEMDLQPVNLGGVARALMQEIRDREATCDGIAFEAQETPEVLADPQLMEMVLRNLIENACKFSKGREAPRVALVCTQEEGRLVFGIEDNGVGFDPRYAEKLFRPFERLHAEAKYPGTGIGLANVKRVIERHGGEVWAEGDLDKGASFFFSLPLATAL